MSEPRIRRATPADAAGIAAVLGVIASEHVHSAIDQPWSVVEEERYLASLYPREALQIAAHEASGIVGFQSLDLWSPLTSMAHVAQVGTFLLPEWRSRGIGRQLWIATEAFARVAGYRKLVIQVRASNTAAQGFHKRLGFRKCGRMKDQVLIDGVADDEILLEYFLPLTFSRADSTH